ncbi:MAG: MFS transporter [Candidatus Microgenomates bacterium]|jgi:MFS family permease
MFAPFFRRHFAFTKDVVWSKVILYCFTIFFIRLADAIISFWAPNQIQSVLASPVVMGLIISFQSVVGFAADLVFPKMLRTTKTRRLIFLSIILSALTSFFLVASVFKPFVLIFLVTMALWGIYYELAVFGSYQFMGSVVPPQMRSGAWAIAGMFINLAYFLGPLIAAYLLIRGYFNLELVILLCLIIAFIIFTLTKSSHDAPTQIDLKEVNPWVELKHWLTLSKHIWPAIILSLLLGIIDSTFWTTGAVWSEKLASVNLLGGLFLPLYQFPSIFLGVFIASWGIYKGKKILSEKILILAGLFLIGLALSGTIAWQLTMVLLSSIALAVCYPLVDGVYTDIVARMGKERKEMIGLISSITNVAYVIWPPVAGYIALIVGERLTFSIVGGLVVVVAIILIFLTPKKLRLPQKEMEKWD